MPASRASTCPCADSIRDPCPLYDKYDLWQVAADGSKAQRLTDGAAEQIRHRPVRLDQAADGGRRRAVDASISRDDEWIDLGQPVYLSLYGERTALAPSEENLSNGMPVRSPTIRTPGAAVVPSGFTTGSFSTVPAGQRV